MLSDCIVVNGMFVATLHNHFQQRNQTRYHIYVEKVFRLNVHCRHKIESFNVNILFMSYG